MLYDSVTVVLKCSAEAVGEVTKRLGGERIDGYLCTKDAGGILE